MHSFLRRPHALKEFEVFEDETERCSDALGGAVVEPTTVGRLSKSAGSSEVELPFRESPEVRSNSGCQRDRTSDQWRQKVVKSLKRPWKHRQEQPSWDSVRTVELQEESQSHYAEQRALCFCGRWWWAMQGWVLAILVGALCFLTYVIIELGIGGLYSIRFGFCSAKPFRTEELCPAGSWHSWGDGIFAFCISVGFGTAMSVASAWLVCRFAPAASGSGIPEVKTILNGFVLSDVVTFRTLCIKVPALVLAVSSGMALGHEGPMVHVAVCWAHVLTRLFPQFRNEGKKRELFSAAVAAGVSSAFGTPVGGVLFSLEEVSSHFPSKTLLLAFLASVTATLALSLGDLTGTGHLTLFNVTYTVWIHPSEYIMFAILGISGGLVGAVFNTINIRWNAIRMRPAFRKHVWPIAEVAFISFLTLVSSWPLTLTRPLNAETIHALFDTCSAEPGETRRSRLQTESGLCTSQGNYTVTRAHLLASLGGAAAIRFCQTALTIGTVCPAGLFVPSLFIGACLGRCMGGTVKAMNAGHRLFSHNIDPGVYSMVGAAAVLGGVCRMTISLVVIMLELTGGLDYVVPFMIAVLVAKAVGDALNEGIYDLYIVLKGYPFLHEELEVTFTERCCDIMETQLTRLDLGSRPSVADLRNMLGAFNFRGFPVTDGAYFVGYIRRQQLEHLLDCFAIIHGEQEALTLEALQSGVESTVMRMVPDTPLSQAHQVFKQLGCKHIFVVGSQGPGKQDSLLGILSKKSFLRFLKDGRVGHMPDHSCDGAALLGSSSSSVASQSVSLSPQGTRFSVVEVAFAAGHNAKDRHIASGSESDDAHQSSPRRSGAMSV